jgi:DNA-binding CsgD family transcriptional regulator
MVRVAQSDGQDRLILALHRGPLDRWSSFLEALCENFDLSYATLIFRHGQADNQVLAEFSAGPAEIRRHRARYRSIYSEVDPLPYHQMERGRSYSIDQLLAADHPFYADFLVPAGLERMLIARVVEPSGYAAWLSICRDRDRPKFTRSEQAQFDALLPHVEVALRTFAVLERYKVHAAIARHLSGRLAYAALAVTKDRLVLTAGAKASAIIEGGNAIAVSPDNRLRLADRTADKRLGDAIRDAADGTMSRALRITSGDTQIEILVVPFSSTSTYGSARPDAVIFLHQEGTAAESDAVAERLAEMFDLTPIECEIAQGLARGRTMAQLAGDLDMSENTIRSYSKSIYGKLGVRRQVDLVRLMLHSVAILA